MGKLKQLNAPHTITRPHTNSRPKHTELQHRPTHNRKNTRIIRKLKRRKTPGPDDIPTELLKELKTENLKAIQRILTIWWNHENIDAEKNKSQSSTNLHQKETLTTSKTTDHHHCLTHYTRYSQQYCKGD